MSDEPVICFGQQPCGFLPRRFLFAKIQTARRVQREIGGRIVFFFHDSDHDPRETQTIVHERSGGAEQRLNFAFANKVQKKYTPLYAKRIVPGWQDSVTRQLPKYAGEEVVSAFKAVQATTVADFCLEMYRLLGLLEDITVIRSSDPKVREAACAVEDYFVDVSYSDEIVRARRCDDGVLRLHQGGDSWLQLPGRDWRPHQVSPTRDTRLRWMQSVVRCTHYIAGAGEMNYLDTAETPEVTFIRRDPISESHMAFNP